MYILCPVKYLNIFYNIYLKNKNKILIKIKIKENQNSNTLIGIHGIS